MKIAQASESPAVCSPVASWAASAPMDALTREEASNTMMTTMTTIRAWTDLTARMGPTVEDLMGPSQCDTDGPRHAIAVRKSGYTAIT